MARYHLSWEVAGERLPNEPLQIAKGWLGLIGMVREDLASGALTDWGAFPGDRTGYAVLEGSEIDVLKLTLKYAPHVVFQVKPAVSAEEIQKFLKGVAG